MSKDFIIREANPSEYSLLSQIIITAYSALEGFPSVEENPDYYQTFSDLSQFSKQKATKILVAVSVEAEILGGLIFYGQAADYGGGVIDTNFSNYAGIRLLAVKPEARKQGIAKALTNECLQRAKKLGRQFVLLHTTNAMKIAWEMYEKMGFSRWSAIDFQLNNLLIYGFRKEI